MGDPAEKLVLMIPSPGIAELSVKEIHDLLEDVELSAKVHLEPDKWESHEGIIAIPWKSSESGS